MELTLADGDDQFGTETLPNGTRLLNGQYVIERYLSSGGFGITYFARDSLDRRVVIKECFPEAFCSRKNRTVMARSHSHQGEFRSFVDMFVREARSIARLKHPNIVGVHQVFRDNETAYMALDLIDGKDLFDVIEASDERPSYQEIKPILLKLLDAISTIHDQDMLHRDISPDNILIDAWDNPILIDFGAAREEASKKSRALSAVLVVKDGYSPQEFYIAGSQQTPCSDLYALAATFVHFISGEAPPNSQTRLAAIASKKPDPYQPLAGRIEGCPAAFLEAIDMAMNVFPQDRIQTAQDWILRIDAQKRKAAALACAKGDRDIEKTVTQLIRNAQQEAETSLSVAAPKSGSKSKAAAVASHGARSEIQMEHLSLRPDPKPPQDMADARDQHVWIARCQKEGKRLARSRKSGSRTAAQLVLAASLIFLILDGHAATFAEFIAPFVEQVMSLAQENIASLAKV